TKHNYLVMHVEELAQTIREAFYIARTGRPGPGLIDIPKDVQIQKTEYIPSDEPVRLKGYRPPAEVTAPEIERALELINQAERPIILAGHGILMSGATRELREFAERARIPVAQTLLGLGNFPASHPL